MAKNDTFADRYKFNWGYYDAKNDVKSGKEPAWRQSPKSTFDILYQAGYEQGLKSINVTVDAAWKRYKASIQK